MGLIDVCTGDLTTASADAIVTSTSRRLRVSGGVNGALHAAAGPALLEAIRGVGTCEIGEAFSTVAGDLDASHVIHTVAPKWTGGVSGEPALLAATYRAVLECAATANCRTVACPSLATGAYGFPLNLAAEIAVKTVAEYLEDHDPTPRLVRFVTPDAETHAAYGSQIATLGGWQRAARHDDYWFEKLEIDPLSATRPLRWERMLDDSEAFFLRAGAVPREMEEKWFIYEAAGTVHCHRSWTGFEIFSFRARARPDGRPGVQLDQLQVCDDAERYTTTDDAAVLEQLEHLVDWLASGAR